MKKIILIILIIIVNCNLTAQVDLQTTLNNTIFKINKNDMQYLRYFMYINEFDSSFVQCQIGEFRIFQVGDTSRILLNVHEDFYSNTCVIGDSALGEDLYLKNLSTSSTFTMPDSGEVHFFRYLSVYKPCGQDVYEGDCDNPPFGDGMDKHWLVGYGNILDDTEFVIQIRNAQTHSLICTIDSVGVLRNPNSCYAGRYGTDPSKANHVRQLPTGYGGTGAYISVSPRRNGPTPYGMRMNVWSANFSQSTLLEYDTLNISKCDSPVLYDSLFVRYFEKYLQKCDSIRLAGSKITSDENAYLSYCSLFNESQADTYFNRYFDPVVSPVTGDTAWVEKDTVDFNKNPVWIVQDGRFIDVTDDVAHIEKMWPNPSPGGNLNLMIVSKENLPEISVSFNDMQGRKIESVQLGRISKGENEFNLQLGDLNTGAYMLVLRGPKNAVIDTRKFIITE